MPAETTTPAGDSAAAPGHRRVERHDFRQPVLPTDAELRRLQALPGDIAAPVRAERQACGFALRELTSLRAGGLNELPTAFFSHPRVLSNGVPKFTGTVGLEAGRVAA